MPFKKPARVFQLVLHPPAQMSLFGPFSSDITERISPGARITRYGREWIIGQTEESDGILYGRIGYQGEAGLAEIWDDERKDFVATATPTGLTAPFAIDLDSYDMAIQSRAPFMSISPMIGAFEALLSLGAEKWEITGARTRTTLANWKASIEKLTFVKLVIREPNPHYHGAKDLESLMKDLDSEVMRVEARSESGLDMASNFLLETEGHLDRGYGEGEYRGVRGSGLYETETSYNTRIGSEESSEEFSVDPGTGEVSKQDLYRIFRREQG
jgi:hypothetical protein